MRQNLLRLGRRTQRKRKASQADADLAEDEGEACAIPLVVGSDCSHVLDIASTLAHAGATGQNFVMVPLFHDRLRRADAKQRNGLITRSEVALPHEDWVGHVVGKFSRWIDLDSSSHHVRRRAEEAFLEEYAYASHLGLQAIVFTAAQGSLGANSLRNLKLALTKFSPTSPQIWLNLAFSEHSSPWAEWDKARHFLDHDRRLGVVLDMSADSLPSLDSAPTIAAWAAEPVKAIIIPTSLFRRSKSGGALLVGNKADRRLLQWFTHRGVQVALRGASTQQSDVKELVRALTSMHAKSLPLSTSQALQREFNSKYRDVLQSPLDPLCVNLDSETYQVMEEDPVKYALYADALHAAMRDVRMQTESSTVPTVLRVLVVGPGRGPLIAATLQRFQALCTELHMDSSKWTLRVVAIEKNGNAVIALRNRFAESISEGVVRIVAGDMREVIAGSESNREWGEIVRDKVDIIVSELLGSWGDNEASPECLAAVQPLLRPHGVMIPQQYCSYLAPIATSKLWTDAREMFWGARGAAAGKEGLDCPYVVQMESFAPIATPQPAFQFEHPADQAADSFCQQRHLRFDVRHRTVLHGFAGYFSCVLYKHITMSTVPADHSEGMFSWFPAFLPVRQPVSLAEGQQVVLDVWRCSQRRKMWYEWSCAIHGQTESQASQHFPIQNLDGHSYSVNL